MKKAFNIISVFILLLTIVSGVFFVNKSETVVAGNLDNYTDLTKQTGSPSTTIGTPINEGCKDSNDILGSKSCVNTYKGYNGKTVGKIEIKEGGEIAISYRYGFSELLIYAELCATPILNDDKVPIGCKNDDYSGKKYIIHVSGDYAKKGYYADNSVCKSKTDITTSDSCLQSKTVHLFNYLDYDSVVRLSLIVEFAVDTNYKFPLELSANSNNLDRFHATHNTGFFKPLEHSAVRRVDLFAISKGLRSPKQFTTHYVDKKQLIYTGGNNMQNVDVEKEWLFGWITTTTTYKVPTIPVVSGVELIVDNTSVSGASSNVEDLIFETIIPTLLIILVIIAGITTAVLGVKIIRGADEPEQRREKINALRNILIGVAVAFIILLIAEPVTDFVKGLLK